MTTLIAERPILTSIGLGLMSVLFLFAWLQSGRREPLIGAAVFAALIPLAFYVASVWITDRERITTILHDTAADVAANRVGEAVDVVADETKRSTAAALLSRFNFTEARVTGIRSIDVNDDYFPPTATSDILAKISLSGGGIGSQTIPRRLILQWEKQNDQWRVVDYEHLPVVGKADNFSGIR